eukprot:TRINITY_DN61345_c0_g1_i1.p1 TRINITY_DN61345_c0_g1~~TRINITY_DN61345_c0_g1_i1.p1  ORF type:complete len:465 (+),score=53.81 TRINITY_DN61345_c0_g1_i1:47-1396(+)
MAHSAPRRRAGSSLGPPLRFNAGRASCIGEACILDIADELRRRVSQLQQESEALQSQNSVYREKLQRLENASSGSSRCTNAFPSTTTLDCTAACETLPTAETEMSQFLVTSQETLVTRDEGSSVLAVAAHTTAVRQGVDYSANDREFTSPLQAVPVSQSVWTCIPRRLPANTLMLLDYVASIVILVNVFVLGIETTMIWRGWEIIETFFLLFYIAELAVKLHILGWWTFFVAGSSLGWNWFDALIVVAAILDVLIDFFYANDFSSVTVRCFRLTKIARLLRLLRLPSCRDFDMDSRRFLRGMQSMKGSMILLGFTVWTLSVMVNKLVGVGHVPHCDRFPDFDKEREILFSDIFRSFLTVFRCVNGDCSTSYGTSLPVAMYEIYGWTFIVPFIFCSCAITYGMLNLCAALFLECTLTISAESAEEDPSHPVRLASSDLATISHRQEQGWP